MSSRLTEQHRRTEPLFFSLKSTPGKGWGLPTADDLWISVERAECPECVGKIGRLVGEGSCRIVYGKKWTDFISASDVWPLVVTERVVEGLEGIGATGFEARRMHITEIKPEQLRVLAEPTLYYLSIHGRIRTDDAAGGRPWVKRCRVCGAQLSRPVLWGPRRDVPIVETWDGSDLFTAFADNVSITYCTRRVLELARRDRWTNCCFMPMDADRRYSNPLKHLGKAWPPKKWYDDPPYAGKTMGRWLEQLRDPERMVAREAEIALVNLGEAAIPELLKIMEGPDRRLSETTARMLASMGNEIPFTDDLLERIKPHLPKDMAEHWPSESLYGENGTFRVWLKEQGRTRGARGGV